MDSSLCQDSSSTSSVTYATVQRLGRQSATCKLTSVVITGATILLSTGRMGGQSLFWAAAPIGLLAIADAGYMAKGRSLIEMAGRNGNGGTPKWNELFQHEATFGGVKALLGTFASVASLALWPFYLSLALILAGMGSKMATVSDHAVAVTAYNPMPGVQAQPFNAPNGGGSQPRPMPGPVVPGTPPAPGSPQMQMPNRPAHLPSPGMAQPLNGQPRPAIQGPVPINGTNRPPQPTPVPPKTSGLPAASPQPVK